MQDNLPKNDLVLLGAGHTNAHVIRMWRMHPIPETRLTCVTNFGTAAYSGMLPGVLAGDYRAEDFQIDLVRLCAAAGIRLIEEEVISLDIKNQALIFASRPPVRYDLLSIGIGSVPTVPEACQDLSLLIKPMQTFLDRLNERLESRAATDEKGPLRLAVVGAGAAGVEVALCIRSYLKRQYPDRDSRLLLIDRGDTILPGMPSRTQRLAMKQLDRFGVEVLLRHDVCRTDQQHMYFEDAEQREVDLVLWATSAGSPALLGKLGLSVDQRGFLRTRETLQTRSSDKIYAVGDTGSLDNNLLPKAGVYAVRQGPTLWRNLNRQLKGLPLKNWKPQSSFLRLLNTGDRRAILTYKGWSIHSRWCWSLKDAIDRKFMRKHQDYRKTTMSLQASSPKDVEMHCGGCGCKLPSDTLKNVLQKLDNPPSSRVVVGLEQAEDVALLRPMNHQLLAVSTDFFTPFFDDPYLVGRIAALNALSDLYAKRACPTAALAIATVPYGDARQQEDYLTQLLAGGLQEFRQQQIPLVGGHTTEGPQATIGFTVLGDASPEQVTKSPPLRAGDHLVITKPLGTGVLLAGHSLAMCHHAWMRTLLDSMLQSNHPASNEASRLGVKAMTDITGFGLIGHLMTLIQQTGLSAELSLKAVPLLPGVEQLVAQGVQSTLSPGNRSFEKYVDCPQSMRQSSRYQALFDPQTSGGLLIVIPAESGFEPLADGSHWVSIGRLVESTQRESRVCIK